jgi:hypothetical protein
MRTFLKRRLPVIAVLAVLLTGGAVAAMAAGGSTASHARTHQHGSTPLRGRRVLQAAAGYIGIPLETLEQDLRSGKSLGQVATEAGKTEAGLVQALATAAKAGLEQRLAQAVKQPGGLRGEFGRAHKLRTAAAQYLGLAPAELNVKLQNGATLGQLADATPGHSRAGLISSLLAAHRSRVSNPLATNGKSPTAKHSAHLRRRIAAFVDRPHATKTTKASKSTLGG